MEVLNSNKKRVRIFEEGIKPDKNLPKYSILIAEKKAGTYEVKDPLTTPEGASAKPEVNKDMFESIAGQDIREMNILIDKESLDKITKEYPVQNIAFVVDHSRDLVISNATASEEETSSKKDKKPGLLQRIFRIERNNYDKNKKPGLLQRIFRIERKNYDKNKNLPLEDAPINEMVEINVIDFFSDIKGLAKSSVESYKDRVEKYVVALRNADKAGQVALKERLLKNLIINKYEAFLYATGNYYAITEDLLVEFVNKCEKGLSLDYLSNFVRPMPNDVVNIITEMNKLEVFDNYVVLHYDPERTGHAKTKAEEEEEDRKRKDPILFGVIAGSNKLYYITDWIDEYCNLIL